MRYADRNILPTPFFPEDTAIGMDSLSGAHAAYATSAWLVANRLYYTPFSFPASVSLFSVSFLSTTAAGNFDIAIYDRNFNRLASLGTTAMTAAIKTFTFSDLRIEAGVLHYCGLVLSSTSDSIFRRLPASIAQTVAAGMAQESPGSTVCPDPGTPVIMSNSYIPLLAYGIR